MTSDKYPPPEGGLWYQVAVRTAWVAASFSLVVASLLLYDYGWRQAKDPHEAQSLKALKLALRQQPTDEALKAEIRSLDLQLRQTYFRQRAFTAVGSWLLLAGVAVFLVAVKSAATQRRSLPSPTAQPVPEDTETRWTGSARWAVAGLALVLVGAAIGLSLSVRAELPGSEDEPAEVTSVDAGGRGAKDETPAPTAPKMALAPPSEEQVRTMWPSFRGPGGAGISAYGNIPESWDEASKKNVVWKTAVPLPGHSSPVVWGDRLFLTGATEDKREVYCFDVKTGKLEWQKEVAGTAQSKALPKVNEETGYAASTAASDGHHVYAMFANGDVAAFDFEGKLVWMRSLGVPDNSYGHAASLALAKNLLVVQFDQGGRKDGKSKILALDVMTGKSAWEVKRAVPNSWGSPIVIRHQGRDQIIACGDPWVIAYKPEDGSELWKASCLRGDCGVSATYGAGLVHVGNEYCKWTAIRPDGSGEVTKTHVVWTGEDGLPDTCSPLATEQHVFLLSSPGTLTCYDAKKGDLLWQKDFEAIFTSSPSLVGNRVYIFGEAEEDGPDGEPVKKSKGWVVEPSQTEGKVIAESKLEEGCVTSPAFQDGRMYLRGRQHLYCIGQK